MADVLPRRLRGGNSSRRSRVVLPHADPVHMEGACPPAVDAEGALVNSENTVTTIADGFAVGRVFMQSHELRVWARNMSPDEAIRDASAAHTAIAKQMRVRSVCSANQFPSRSPGFFSSSRSRTCALSSGVVAPAGSGFEARRNLCQGRAAHLRPAHRAKGENSPHATTSRFTTGPPFRRGCPVGYVLTT